MTDVIQPRDEADMFCTCPGCGLLGNHGVEVLQWEGRWLPGSGGERVDTSMFSDPPIGSWNAHRTCWSCGHTWRTPAGAVNSTSSS
jgi:hypothetical protein